MPKPPLTAVVSNIQKFCIHDGPGIRTVVFFMGCPLRCKWCQNPENIMYHPVIMYDPRECIGCDACITACKKHATFRNDTGELVIDRSICNGCGECTAVCHTKARSLVGKRMTVDEVFHEVMKDKVFYQTTGGGITFSGGEASIYAAFIAELSQKIRAEGVNVALETCGYCTDSALKLLSESIDIFLYDFKLENSDRHKDWTAVPNQRVKENLKQLIRDKRRVIIRIPLIPGVNDGEEFQNMMQYLSTIPGISEINILPFHQFGSSKYMLIAHEYELEDQEECPDEIVAQCVQIAQAYPFRVNVGGWDIS